MAQNLGFWQLLVKRMSGISRENVELHFSCDWVFIIMTVTNSLLIIFEKKFRKWLSLLGKIIRRSS